ncbi:MAG TPA: hypothetical protein VNJ07_11065 [Chitinophagales bacterium]|nr:hypothetical protein [Chitinophagales bacterium]
MAKAATYPALLDNCLQISITALKRWGYLSPSQFKRGTLTWSRGEGERKEITGRIDVLAHTDKPAYLELRYICSGTPISYRVQLVSIPSNLGKGAVWFFICPHTGKRCRKLYLIGEKFLHRAASRNAMYEKQTFSKRWRKEKKTLDTVFSRSEILDEIEKPYFKTEYNGNPTKRFQKLLHRAMRFQSLSLADILAAM